MKFMYAKDPQLLPCIPVSPVRGQGIRKNSGDFP